MSEDKKNHSIQLWLAIISLVGVLGTAVISNWDTIFPKDSLDVRPAAAQESINSASKQNSDELEVLNIHFFVRRQSDVTFLQSYLKRHGYIVNMTPISNGSTLIGEKNTPSYLYFNPGEFQQASQIQELIEESLGHKVNVYKYKEPRSPLSFGLILTEAE